MDNQEVSQALSEIGVLMELQGDVGARNLIERYAEAVAEVAVNDTAALVDVDTPEALSAVKAELEGA